MTSGFPNQPLSDAETIRARVLRGLLGNRVRGLHFAGHFLGVTLGEPRPGGVEVSMPGGIHGLGPDGQVDLSALGVLADIALASSVRRSIGPVSRLGTIRLELQYAGEPITGDLSATGALVATKSGSSLRQYIANSVIFSDGVAVCHASGEFVELELPPGVEPADFSWRPASQSATDGFDTDSLTVNERLILESADVALAKANATITFIQHFLGGGQVQRTVDGSRNRIALDPHLRNRVDHAQGGLLFGMAANTARIAAPDMKLSSVTAWYLRPGKGKELAIQSRLAHVGRATALVHTEITDDSGALVLFAVSQHVKGRLSTSK